MNDALLNALKQRGVIVHAPAATVIEDVDASAFEAGVEIFPAVTIRGKLSRFGAGTKLGKAGGGYFENVVTGRNVDLFGGYYQDCALFDDVTLRGSAEVRGGTLLEEGCEGAHHVGYKMTVMLPWVVAGSLVNFCDALMAGGTSRKNHSEIGSSLALYNFTPWGDKHASIFGDIPRGVFQREAPVFVGGQTQIVSPVRVGFGAVLTAGSGIRRDVPDHTIYGEEPTSIQRPFEADQLGAIESKVRTGLFILGNLVAHQNWYAHVRQPTAGKDAHKKALYTHAERQLEANVNERIKRIKQLLERIEGSRDAHQKALDDRADGLSFAQRYRRLDDHDRMKTLRPAIFQHFERISAGDFLLTKKEAAPLRAVSEAYRKDEAGSLPAWLRDTLPDALLAPAQRQLYEIIDSVAKLPTMPKGPIK